MQGRFPKAYAKSNLSPLPDDTQLLVNVGCAREARRASVREWAETWRGSMAEIFWNRVLPRTQSWGTAKQGAQEILVTAGRR